MQITAVDGFTLVTPSGRHNEAMEGSFAAVTMDDVNEALQIRASGYPQKPVTGGESAARSGFASRRASGRERYMKSIQTKFIALILGCVMLCTIVIGGAGILSAQRVVDGDSAQIMNQISSERACELNGLLSRIEQSVETLAVYTAEQLESVELLKTDDAYLAAYTKKLEEIATNAASNTEGALAVYVRFNPEFTPPTSGLFWSKTNLSGSFQQLTPTDFSGYDPSDVEHVGWYYIPVKNGRAIWMAPYLNQNINIRMISYVIPLYAENEIVGVVGMDIDFGIIETLVDSIRAYESGYAFLTDDQGTLMYHRDYPLGTKMESVNTSLLSVVRELGNGTSGSKLFTYADEGEEKRMAFRTLHNGMRLVISAPTAEIDEAKNSLILQIVVSAAVISALAVLLTILLTRRLIRPLKELNTAAQQIASGDFSVTISHQTKDEVGTLADSFQQTVAHLQTYIGYINGLAYRDPLTGVKNKTAYQDAEKQFEERMRSGRPEFALVVMDINGLKQVNDNFGHDFGDMLIMDACKLMCKVFKRSPIYRIGGDEFVAILESGDLEHYQELLEYFQTEMDAMNRESRPDNRVSIARGFAIYNSETDLVFANVFKRADDSMYKNKAAMKEHQQ